MDARATANAERLAIILSSMKAGDEPVGLALVFPDGGVSLTISGRPVAEGLAEYLAASGVTASQDPEESQT